MSSGEKLKPPVASPPARPAASPPLAPPVEEPREAVPPPAPPPPQADAEADADADAEPSPSPGGGLRIPRRLLEGTGAFFSSVIFHLVLFIVLALVLVPEAARQEVLPLTAKPVVLEEEEERIDQFLDQQDTPSLEQAVAIQAEAMGQSGSEGAVVGSIPPPDVALVHTGEKSDSEVSISEPLLNTPPSRQLIEELPAGTLGDARAIVDDYQEAMDRITRELLMLLEKHRVCVIWCFDRSESMLDDQREIRDRIERVYAELGLDGRASGGALVTAVTSYGEGFGVHTEKPTANVDDIRRAIAAVPVDHTGIEMMCPAIVQSINLHRQAAKGRKMVLILVTDETGEKEDTNANLEATIAVAKDAGCIIYVLGREAVFGYPYAYMRWKHPQTGEVHWLPIDRGPETAFVEQLQTNGFRRRNDAFPSGFGPYEQARMARETGGIFFMLPSVETSIVRGENRRYELEAMRSYRPDLRSRPEIYQENAGSVFRSRINEVIYSLNPWNEEVRPHIELRIHFSPDPPTFIKQAHEELAKSLRYVAYLDRAESVFASEEMQYLRSQETSPRWQANYDLLYAQVIAYKVRNFEYAAYLDWFLKNPIVVPLTKEPNLRLVHWDIHTRKETLTSEKTASMVAEARERFAKVIDEHPGTPWAARAQGELRRGFGVHLTPHYRAPYRTPSGPKIPVPKL